MELNIEEISKIVTISKPIIDPIIAALIKPKVNLLSNWLTKREKENKILDNFFEDKFCDYLSLTLNKCKNVNVLIFQNQQIKIEDIYYPLKIRSSKNSTVFQIDSLNKSLFNSYKKILISDTAGMGKSTLSKWIAKKVIEQQLAIPILIELRNLKDNHTVLDEIFLQINPIDKSFDIDLILKFIELGNFLIIFDGFDEIQLKNQETIIKDVRDFIDKAHNNWFLLTSRPEGALAAFGDFQLFNIEHLSSSDAYKLIEKYDSISPVKISKNLIKNIKNKIKQVRELLGNPFLVSLLYSTYTYNRDIPASKLSFYEEIYSALFKKHDLSKDGWTRPKKSQLDIQQFRVLLRQLAFDTALLGEVTYSETELIQLVEEAIKKCPGLQTNSNGFIEDLVSTVPLFQRDGLKIKWAHKSLQDFFVSEYIAYDSKKELYLNTIYDKEIDSFNNILDFLIELDYKTFRKTFIRKLLIDFINHYDNSYKNIDPSIIKHEEINLRRCKTFGSKHLFKKGTWGTNSGSSSNPFDEFNDYRSIRNKTLTIRAGYFVLIIGSIKIEIINALSSKNVSFLKEGHREAKAKELNVPGTLVYELTDDPQSFFNKKVTFPKVTNTLIFTGRGSEKYRFPILDYEEAKKELNNIEFDLQRESDAEVFTIFDR